MKLDFVCLGGNKCGTTWLYQMLKQHPELNLSLVKEPHFFTKNRDKGLDWYTSNWDLNQKGLKGECSTTYFYSELGQRKIKDLFPNVKVLILLRNPEDRSISHFRHLLRGQKVENYTQFINDRHPEVIDNSIYFDKIQKTVEIFGQENTKVLLFDHISAKPRELLRDVFQFLNVNLSFMPKNYDQKIGGGYDSYNKSLEKLRIIVSDTLKRLGLPRIIRLLKASGATKFGKNRQNKGLIHDLRIVIDPYKRQFVGDLSQLSQLKFIENSETVLTWIESIRSDEKI